MKKVFLLNQMQPKKSRYNTDKYRHKIKLLIKFSLFLILLSFSSREIKISKHAKINDFNQYENNYLSEEKRSIKNSKFFIFFFKNIFFPKKKKNLS